MLDRFNVIYQCRRPRECIPVAPETIHTIASHRSALTIAGRLHLSLTNRSEATFLNDHENTLKLATATLVSLLLIALADGIGQLDPELACTLLFDTIGLTICVKAIAKQTRVRYKLTTATKHMTAIICRCGIDFTAKRKKIIINKQNMKQIMCLFVLSFFCDYPQEYKCIRLSCIEMKFTSLLFKSMNSVVIFG